MNRYPVAAAFALFAGLATPAQAETPQLRVAVIGGLERTDSAPGSGAEDGVYYGVQLGADWDLGGIKAGVEAELGDSTANAPNSGNQANQSLFGNAAVRVAVPITDGTRVFVRGGYAYHKIDYAVGPDFDGHGYTLGGGAEVDLGQRLFVRGEYRFSDYGQTVRGQQFLAGLGYRF
jgi:outer membrane immunogenic protein